MKEEPHEKIVGESSTLENTHEKNQLTIESSAEEKVDLSIRLEKEILALDKKNKVRSPNGVSEGTSEYYNFNTEGLKAFEKSGSVGCYTSCLMEEGTQNGMHYKSSSARSINELEVDFVINESYKKGQSSV